MRILDKDDKEILERDVDYSKGYLTEERRFVKRHEAVEAVEEQGHWNTVAEYPNGGKDVEWVVDVERVEAKEAYDEYEDILRFMPFGQEELDLIKIDELKKRLSETDYVILKMIEGELTMEDCAETIAKRKGWRKEINKLEGTIKNGVV